MDMPNTFGASLSRVNEDAHLDLILVAQPDPPAAGYFRVYYGVGDGTFTDSGLQYEVGTTPTRAFLGDINGDDRDDVVVASTLDENLYVFINSGAGSFADGGKLDTGVAPTHAHVVDMTADGLVDVISNAALAELTDGRIRLFSGDGAGNFETEATINPGSTNPSITVGDYNGDGAMDMASAHPVSHTLRVFISEP